MQGLSSVPVASACFQFTTNNSIRGHSPKLVELTQDSTCISSPHERWNAGTVCHKIQSMPVSKNIWVRATVLVFKRHLCKIRANKMGFFMDSVVVVWQLTDVISGDTRHGIEGSAPKCRLLLKTYWSRMRRWILRTFQILIVSAVKICKQCLQTASARIEASPLDPTGELLSSRPSGLKLPNENSWRRHWPQNTSNAARLTSDARHGLGG